ncbi:MAG: SAM-dependent methyltransferase, partial [Flavobacteriaceae bacterium]|nr:SAM-dependent methyltransferase [Flavobacteriaceae bacterium]
QTFFCSLSPELRSNYVEKMASLLNDNGKLIGLLFDFPLTEEGPPYGGSLSEYMNSFSKEFNTITLERCYNSIKPRDGRELFIIFEKK